MSIEDYTLNELRASVEVGYELIQDIPQQLRDMFFRGDSVIDMAEKLVYNEYPIESLEDRDKVIRLCALAVNNAINGNNNPELGIVYGGVISNEEYCLFKLDNIEQKLNE